MKAREHVLSEACWCRPRLEAQTWAYQPAGEAVTVFPVLMHQERPA